MSNQRDDRKQSNDASGGVSPVLLAFIVAAVAVLFFWQTDSVPAPQPVAAGTPWPSTEVEGWLNGPGASEVDSGNETSSPEVYDLNASVQSGKVVFVDCMASWCGPCLAAMPRIVKAAEDYEPLGVEFVSLTSETSEDVEKLQDFLAASPGVDWPLGLGAYDFFNALEIRSIPTYVIFVNGKVSWSGIGHADFTNALDQAVAARKSGQ